VSAAACNRLISAEPEYAFVMSSGITIFIPNVLPILARRLRRTLGVSRSGYSIRRKIFDARQKFRKRIVFLNGIA
jgi:hypothetical protein